ncbi:PREDICTED: uncharacterized protein C9orf43 homolog [Galeopterus variegatus]|uniref:Uncharacterized protein C9orf43 homolog n=1 Tax=Galeopterus variegatus TaxID=482537 RepID=A0ABM0QF20_GALVR|nr:PREDICTED: uncharacterized protein C9orf43 homolog [Galeopterus variegatus]
MELPDESQWDETTCDLAVCQHPQCWATIRRIERGHPRILGSPCRTPLDAEDKLPALTIVNISDSCFGAKRLAPRHFSEFTFTKAPSLLSWGSKFDSKFRGRSQKGLPGKSLINHTNRSPKLSVLNLNETQLPCSKDVGNMVVIWIPEKLVSPAEKKPVFPSQNSKKKKKLAVQDEPSLGLSEKPYGETQLRTPGVVVPSPSPVHLSEQLNSEFIPFWTQFGMLPEDLLKDLLSDGEKTVPCPETKIQLAMMKKNLPLEKNRPDSAISSKMFLSIHRLTLQRPALRYPEHLKKLRYNLMKEGRYAGAARSPGHRKQQQWRQQQQQQRKVKTPLRKQEAKKKAKSDPGSQNASHKPPVTIGYDSLYGYRILPGQERDTKQQQQQMKTEGTTLKQDSTKRLETDYSENYMDLFSSMRSPGLSETEPSNKDMSAPVEAVLESQASSQEKISKNLSESVTRISWNPEFQLLRILQATDDEDEENQFSAAQSEESLEAQTEGITWGSLIPEQDAWHPGDDNL